MCRHEILRTPSRYGWAGPSSYSPALTAPLVVVDLQDVPRSQREAEALRLAAVDLQRPFDLCAAPLLRVTLLRLDDRQQMLLITMHHIITDGWSIDVFRKELRLLYQALSQGRPSPLPPLPIQYADFAIWQRQWLRNESWTLLLYWKRQLDDIPASLKSHLLTALDRRFRALPRRDARPQYTSTVLSATR